METLVSAAEERVAAEIAAARERLNGELRDAEKRMKGYDSDIAKADCAYTKAIGPKRDKYDDKAEAAHDALLAAHERYLQAYDAVSKIKSKLRKLDDPYEVARRVEQYEQKDTANKTSKGGNMSSTKTKTKTTTARASGSKNEVPKNVIERIVKLIDGGKGVTAVAAILAAEKIAAPTASGWYGRAVYNLYERATGKKVGDIRKAKPLTSRKLSDRAPQQTAKLAKKSTSSGKTSATAKKKSSSAKKSSTAKKSSSAKRTNATRSGDLTSVKPDPKAGARK